MKVTTTAVLFLVSATVISILVINILINNADKQPVPSPEFKVGQYLKVKSGFYEGCVGRAKSTMYWNNELGRSYDLQEVVCNLGSNSILIEIGSMRFRESDLEVVK